MQPVAGCPAIPTRSSNPASRGGICIKLYWDAAGGYSERRRVLLGTPSSDGAPATQVAYLPLALRRLRLDPIETPDTFTLGDLLITPLPLTASAVLTTRSVWRRFKTLIHPAYQRLLGARHRERQAALPYREWLTTHEPTPAMCAVHRRRASSMEAAPVISLVMPTYNSNLDHLRAAVASVQAQWYPHWQLCICDDASRDESVRALLREWAAAEPRISLRLSPANGGIAAASAEALALASGDYVGFLDHDDLLPPWALYRVATSIKASPDTDIWYSDEDKLDERGQRCDPHFKPAWNEELLHSINYFGHLLVIRHRLLLTAGGFRAGYDGSQDYDLVLRCVAQTTASRIGHIPGVLYHWRKSKGSTAQALGAKGQAHPSGVAALRAHFGKSGSRVTDGPFPTSYRALHPLPTPAPSITIMIPTRDGLLQLRRCIDSIRKLTRYSNYSLLILDNQSSQPAMLDYLAQLRANGVEVLAYDRPFNFSAINNFGAQHASGELLLLLNDDVELLTADWLDEMVSRLYRPGVGAVGAKLYYPDGRIQHAGVMTGIGGVAGHGHKYYPGRHSGYFGRLVLPQTVAAVTGACLLTRRLDYLACGGLDEHNLAVAFNDVDYCLRLRERGLRSVWTPYAELVHHESLSRGAEDTPEKKQRFFQEVRYMQSRWGSQLTADGSYNPYLTLEHEDFSLSRSAPPFLESLPR